MPQLSVILDAMQHPDFSDVAQTIASVCRIDNDFPGDRNLTETLLQAVESPQWEEHLATTRRHWSEALRGIAEQGQQRGWQLAAGDTRGGSANPLYGRVSEYAVASFLLQRSHPQIRAQAEALRNLYIAALLSDPRACTAESADELRKAIAPKSEHRAFISGFPVEQSPYPANVQALKDHLTTKIEAGIPDTHEQIARHVLSLIGAVGHAKKRSARSGKRKETQGPTQTPRRKRRRTAAPGLRPPAGTEVVARRVPTPSDPDSVEPPQETYTALPVDLHDEDQAEPDLSDAVADAVARQSRHWITRQQRLVPNDPTRFTPHERRRLVTTLMSGMQEDSRLAADASAVLLMSYVTGQLIEAVLEFQVGPTGDLRDGGIYRREVKLPENGYRPPSGLQDFLEPVAEEIQLPLPQPLEDWLTSRCAGHEAPLIESLGYSQAELMAETRQQLKIARDSGRYNRIRLERIAAALRLEISLETRDSVAVHQLSAKRTDAPPILSYYVPHDVDHLVDLYCLVTKRMLDRS